MKSLLLSFYDYLWDMLISKIPSHLVRYYYIRLLNKSITKTSSILMHVRFKGIRTIEFNNNQIINQHATIDGRGGLILGENIDIAERAVIWSMSHDPYHAEHATLKSTTTISNYAWIGADSIILAGVHVGEGAVIGSGSVVTKNVKPLDIVAGNPAKVIGQRKSLPKYKLNYKPLFK
jgi:acetyltransferase-like isoleucine patch superfamily enzyme